MLVLRRRKWAYFQITFLAGNMQNGDQISLQGITIYGQKNGEKAGIKYACQEYEFASVTPTCTLTTNLLSFLCLVKFD